MPDFSKLHSLNRDANFNAVKFGADSVLLETELNELQDIQNERRADVIRDRMPSGFIKLSTIDYDSMKTTTNTIILKDESVAYVNGERIVIPAGTKISLTAPPSTGSRVDFVLLEVWREEIDNTDNIESYGGEGQPTLTNYLKDSRVGIETSRRIQVKWRLRAVENVSDLTSVNAKGQLANESTTKFAKSNSDNGLYTATVTGASVDNVVYALPMFTVNRRNSGGYKVNNVNGALLYGERVVGHTFTRKSVAYKSDLTVIGSHTPRIEAIGGKIGMLIEDSTENLVFTKNITTEGQFNPSDLPSGCPVTPKISSKVSAGDYKDLFFISDNIYIPSGGFITVSGYVYSKVSSGKLDFNCYNITDSQNLNLAQIDVSYGWNFIKSTWTNNLGKAITVKNIRLENYIPSLWANMDNECWGVNYQVELKSCATSFVAGYRQSEALKIPTYGILNANEGTVSIQVYVTDVVKRVDGYYNRLILIPPKSNNWYLGMELQHSGTSNNFSLYCGNGITSGTVLINDTSVPNGWNTFTIRWNSNIAEILVNGVKVGTSIPNLTKQVGFADYLYVGSALGIDGFLNSYFRNLVIFNKYLSDSEVQQYIANDFAVDQYTTYSLKPQGDILLPTSGNLAYPKSVDTTNKRVTFYVPNSTVAKIDKPFTTFKNSMGSVAKIENISGNDILTSVPELTTNNMDYDFNQLNMNKKADIIEEADIKDLRNTVSLTGFDYKSMGESAFKEIVIGGQRRTVKEYIGRWKQFGVTGVAKSDNTGTSDIQAVCVDDYGYIYVLDSGNRRLIKLNPDLTYNSQFGVTGVAKSDTTGIDYGQGVAVDKQGYVYISDHNNNRVIKLNPNLTYNSQFGVTGVAKSDNTGFNRPHALSINSKGDLYVADYANNRLVILNSSDMTYKSSLSSISGLSTPNLSGPVGCYVDKNDNVYIVDQNSGRMIKLDSNLSLSGVITNLYYPRAVCVDENDFVYVLSVQKLAKYNPSLNYVGEIFNKNVKYGLCLSTKDNFVSVQFAIKSGDFYIPDRHNYRLIKITNMPDDVWYDSNTKFPTAILGNQDCDGVKTTFSDAPYFNYNTISVPSSGTLPQGVTRTGTGNWASGNTIKIKALRSKDTIMGTLDPNSAKAKILSINGTTVYLNNVTGIAVNDTISYFAPDLTLGGTATVTAVDTTNKTVTLNTSLSSTYLNGYIFETTAGSSLPLAQFFNSSTKAWENVAGSWTGLGTNEATFTLGTNTNLTNQDIKISYNVVSAGGEGLTFTPKEFVNCEADGELLWKQFGVTGVAKTDNTGFNSPRGVEIDSNGYVYVADHLNHRLVKLNPDLTYNSQFGVTGVSKSDNTGFNNPADVIVDSNGYIYVSDTTNHRLVKLNPDLTYNSQFGVTGVFKSDNTGFNSPYEITIDSNGYVYVADHLNHRLVKLNPDLTYNSQFGVTGVSKSDNTGFNLPIGVAVDSQGYIYVVDQNNHRLVKLNPDLTYNSQFGVTGVVKTDNTGFNSPRSVAVDSNGYIYVSDTINHRLVKLNPDLTYNSQFGVTGVAKTDNTGLKGVRGVAVDSQGYIYIGDYENHRVIKMHPNYLCISDFSRKAVSSLQPIIPEATWKQFGVTGTIKINNTGLNNPHAVAVDFNGYVYVADYNNHRLVKLNPNLTYNSQFGVTGVVKSDNTGLNYPTGVAVDSQGYIYVNDRSNHRLVRLDSNLNFITQFGTTGVSVYDNTGLNNPHGVAVDSNGYIYVIDTGNQRLVKLNPDLTYNSKYNQGLNTPRAVTVDENGYIYIYQSTKLIKLNPDMTYNSELFNSKVKYGLNLGINDKWVAASFVVKNGYIIIPDRYNHRLIKVNLNQLNKPVLPNVAITYKTDVTFPADFSTGTYDIVWKSDRVYYTANGSYDSYTSTFRNIANKVMETLGLEHINQVYPFELSQAQLNLKLPTDVYRAFIEDYNLEQLSSMTIENALSVVVSKTLGETVPYMALLPMIIKKDGQLYLLVKGMLTKSSTMNFTSNFQLIVPIKGNPLVK